MPRFHSYGLPFQSEGNYAFVKTADSMGRRQMKKFPLLQACLRGGGGGGGEVAHFENDTASEK